VTNASAYAGPPAAAALAKANWNVFLHDESFTSADVRANYESQNAGLYATAEQEPAAFVAAALERFGRIDAVISNDIPKGMKSVTGHLSTKSIGEVRDLLADFEVYMDSLVAAPVRLLRAALPSMKAACRGSIVLITSGAPLRVPGIGGPHGYTAARSAANSFAKTLAVELAPYAIQVNAVAPFVLFSQTSFPSDTGVDDPQYVELVRHLVPMGRFGTPEEIGALIVHLASGDIGFVSGQVIAFSGAGC
jgi:3-oxoacyl-[acyl-carrier protein] reductase